MFKSIRINLILLVSTRWERAVTSFFDAFFRRSITLAFGILLLFTTSAPIVWSAETPPLQFERSELSIISGAKRHQFRVEIANTPETRARGLMDRRNMEADAGMLFDFETPRPISMWMKNTYIPLDMLFIDDSGTIIGIASNTTPLSLAVISSPRPALSVLEVTAGTAKRLQISVGDKVLHRLFQP